MVDSNLLSITSIPIKVEINISKGEMRNPNAGDPDRSLKMNIQTKQGELKIHSELPKINIVRGMTFFGVSVPGFWVGLILILVFAVNLGIFPAISSGGDARSLVLPACTLAFAMTAKYTRQVRTAVLEELHQDYVIGARARGVSERDILWRNVLPNSMLPLITLLGLSMGSLLGGTAIVEVIFTYPGMGNLAVNAITGYDYPVIQAYVLWVALIYMVINLVVDISYNYIDPRMRLKR